ncbi:MAG: GNAT family N-acetyltransferase [Asgard group archaeon]|nr:GNAT family N-acetyltransferase [Asgard group archaeon]
MSDYIIKKYEEGFIEEQVKVGTEAIKDWKYFGQTQAEQLKEAYSREDFDPETRLYCFKDDKMVGFLTARVVEREDTKFGFLRLPFFLPEHEEVAELLFNEVVEVFKKKGVDNIRAEGSEVWGNTLDLIKKWNFREKETSFYTYELDLKDLKDLEVDETIEVVDFDFDKDLDQMVKIFIEEFSYTEEQAKQNFETIKNFEGVYAHLIVKEDDKIKGRALAYFTDDIKVAINGYIYGEPNIQKTLQKAIFEKSKEKEVERMQMFFNPRNENTIPTYEEYGFKLGCKGIVFEKDI